jgi:hypothetical protein
MQLLKDVAEIQHFLPTWLEGYSYLECKHLVPYLLMPHVMNLLSLSREPPHHHAENQLDKG